MGERVSLKPEEIQLLRDISVHGIVGEQNNGRRIDGRCPFCGGGNRTPCFSLYPDNSFHCFKCEAHGANAIDYMKNMYPNESFIDICVRLVEYR